MVALCGTTSSQNIVILTSYDKFHHPQVSSVMLLLVYLPALLVARFVFDNALAYYIAMYSPHFAMVLIFGARVLQHMRALQVACAS